MKSKSLFFLIVLFLLMRFLLVFTNVEKTAEGEELYRGTIGQEVLSGLRHPLGDYQADNYSGGSLVIGLTAAVFFKLLGPSLFALKLAPFCFSLAAVLLMFFFLRKRLGENAAVYYFLIAIFSAPVFAQLAFTAMGYHSESVLFSALILILYDAYFSAGAERKTPRLFLWGLVSGLAFWFTHITMITAAASLAAWAWLDFKTLKKQWPVFFAGGLLGLVPWMVYNAAHRFEGIVFIAKSLLGGRHVFAVNRLAKFFDLLTCEIPLSFGFPSLGKIPAPFWNCFYFVLILVLIAWAAPVLWRRTKNGAGDGPARVTVFLLIFPAVYLLIYTFSGVDTVLSWGGPAPTFDDSRYQVPLYFFLFALAGAAAASLPKGRPLLALLLVLGLAGQAGFWFKEPFGRVFRYQGTSYRFLGTIEGQIWPKQFSSFADYLKSVKGLPPARRFYLLSGASYGIQFQKNYDSETARRILENAPDDDRGAVLQGLGYGAGVQQGLRSPLVNSIRPLLRSDSEMRDFYRGFIDGVMTNEGDYVHEHLKEYSDFAAALPAAAQQEMDAAIGYVAGFAPPAADRAELFLPEWGGPAKQWFYQGAGTRAASSWIHENLTFEEAAVSKMPVKVPAGHEDDFYFGFGWGLRQMWMEDGLRARDWAARAPENRRGKILEGLKAYEDYFRLPQ